MVNKKILLTGATGFLGSHLLDSFISKGFEVAILKRSFSNSWRINHIISKIKYYDIDKISLDEVFESERPDTVIHTACRYGKNNISFSDILNTNLFFSVELLQASINSQVSTFINTDTLLPRDINYYSLSKAQFRDWMILKSDEIKVINIKLEYIYGPHDDENKFIPWLINKMLKSEERILLTEGMQKRDFIYITDVVDVFDIIMKNASRLKYCNSFDVGTNDFNTIKDLVIQISNRLQSRFNKLIVDRLDFGALNYRNGEVMIPKLDNRALFNLGWSPKVGLNEGIDLILDNYN
jgi:nucleoside-diphosphate-sugar epimerase